MNHTSQTVEGLISSSELLFTQLREQQAICVECRLALESPSQFDSSPGLLVGTRERLKNAVECVRGIEEQIEFNTALSKMVLDSECTI